MVIQRRRNDGVQRQESVTESETATPPSDPFRVSFTPGGIEVSGKLTSAERADELVAAIQALKMLLKPVEDIQPSQPIYSPTP